MRLPDRAAIGRLTAARQPHSSDPANAGAPLPDANTSSADFLAVQGPAPTDIPQREMIIRFADLEVPIRRPARGQANIPDLPRQAWESIQAAHRRFLDWCRTATFHELILLGRIPSVEPLLPHLVSP